ncbi:MerR family transcriptional regulator [Staphylococcus sp. Marseille-Q1834]|uniref:MerR family transcriptional regulator n=1 Tax=Staphylococcus sp. Marseille-Q1834 TaxID=2866594 RepID=UPI0012B94077|nr:MerR family transcriptional regulator [Staphylococcus sp. Marseille-Q1834]
MSHYSIGELAKQSGITIRTLQYYDRKGLLTAERHHESNRRYYTDTQRHQLQLILILKKFGCTLDEIKTLLYEDNDLQTLKMMLQLHKETIEQDMQHQAETLKRINAVQQYISEQSSSSINHLTDIDNVMKKSQTLNTVKGKIWLSAGLIGLIQYSGLVISLLRSSAKPFVTVLPILVTYAIGLTTFYFKHISYLCPNCQHVFKPSLKSFVLATHTTKTRKLQCPKCHETHYCIEVASDNK